MEKLQDWCIAFLSSDLVIVYLLLQVHWRCVLIEITRQNDEIPFTIIVWILESVFMYELLHLLDLFVSADKGLNVEGYTQTIVAGLKVRVEQMQLVAPNLRQVNLCVQDSFHCDCIVTHRRKVVFLEV